MMLSDFEKQAIECIVKREAPHLYDTVGKLRVRYREHNVVGYYVGFITVSGEKKSDSASATLGKSVYAHIDGLEHGVGLVLYLENGEIDMLEVYSHGSEDLPDDPNKLRNPRFF